MANKRQMTFEANENVLCFHGPLLYEAKVMSPPLTALVVTLRLNDMTSPWSKKLTRRFIVVYCAVDSQNRLEGP